MDSTGATEQNKTKQNETKRSEAKRSEARSTIESITDQCGRQQKCTGPYQQLYQDGTLNAKKSASPVTAAQRADLYVTCMLRVCNNVIG